MATVENFVEKYLPAQLQTQIGEVFRGTFSGKDTHKFEETQKTIMKSINKVILSDDGVPDLLSKIKQTRNLISSGEIMNKGAMYNMTSKEESPPASENSYLMNSKSGISRNDAPYISNLIDKPDEPLVKNSSYLSKKSIGINRNQSKFIEMGNHSRGTNRSKHSPKRGENLKEMPYGDTKHENSVLDINETESEMSSLHQATHVPFNPAHESSRSYAIIDEKEEYSEKDLETFLFGQKKDGDELQPPRIQFMNPAEIARYIVSDMKIKEKKTQYERDLNKQLIHNNHDEIKSKLEQVSKEAREYNMVLHTELEEFVNNKKKEFYQKFIEIKEAKEEQSSIKDEINDLNTSLKQMCVILSCLVESVSITSKVLKHKSKAPVIKAIDMNTSKDSLMSRSFLPNMQERAFSRLKSHDENPVKQSRNLSKELFRQPNSSSHFAQSRLSTKSKTIIKSTNKFIKRLKTPDINLSGKKTDSRIDLNQTPIPIDEKPENELKYRNSDFRYSLPSSHAL